MERPDYPLLDGIEQAIHEWMTVTAELERAKKRIKDLSLKLREIEDVGERAHLAHYIYWNHPEVSGQLLSEAVTGLPGKKGVSAFLRMLPPKDTNITCEAGKHFLQVKSREEQAHVLRWSGGRSGRIRCCNACDEERRLSAVTVERPISNAKPSGDFRRKIELCIGGRGAMTVNVTHIYGGVDVTMGPALLELYLDDPDAAAAKALHVSKEQYLEWLSSWGSIRCDGMTVKGLPCKQMATGQSGLELNVWVERRSVAWHCHLHGGEAVG